MDPDTIPTEPTTDIEPPATAVVTGPSLASTSPAAGRGRGSMIHRAAIGLALVLTFSVGIGVGLLAMPALGTVGTTTPSPTGSAATTDFGLIREAWDVLHSKYVGADELNDKELIYGAINGMTEAVGDTGHTSFLTPEERASRANDLSGQYVGIGVRIDTAEDGLPLIIGVFPDSPAEKAGLAVGDEIVAVDGKPTTGHTIDDVVTWVRGEAGSSVVVTVRPGADRQGARGLDDPRGRGGRPGQLDPRPGHEDRVDPPRPVLDGRRRRPQEGPRPGPRSRCRPAGPRPARQSGRLRQRGRRRGQPVPQERHGLRRARRGRQGDDPSGHARRHRQPTCRSSCSSTAGRPARPRSCRAPSRTPAGPRSSGSRRSGPGRSSASSCSPTGRPCGSARSSG